MNSFSPTLYQQLLGNLFQRRRFQKQKSLEQSTALLEFLNLSEPDFTCIQIVGTNGKGSTAAFLSSLLSHLGLRVGFFSSPHLVDFNERFRINGQPLFEPKVFDGLKWILGQLACSTLDPIFFEIAFALSLELFKREGVQCAVIEAGVGGKLDPTTALASDMVLISSIGWDHVAFLGGSLEAIALDKAEAIRQGKPVLIGQVDANLADLMESVAQDKQASVVWLWGRDFLCVEKADGSFVYQDHEGELCLERIGLDGAHQLSNVGLALASLRFLKGNAFKKRPKLIVKGVSNVEWPGRLQKCRFEGREIWLDGAHNREAIQAVCSFFKEKPFRLVFACMKDKNASELLALLLGCCSAIHIAAIGSERSVEVGELSEIAHHIFTEVPIWESRGVVEAMRCAVLNALPEENIVFCGSLYGVGELLKECG